MKLMIYPGSFDPVTLGHLDIIPRAAKMTDTLVVAIMNNSEKKYFFTLEERLEMIRSSVAELKNVEVDFSEGLMVEYMKKRGAAAAVRGLRAITDFEYELQWVTLNQKLDPEFQALFMMASSEHSFLSSSIVREIGRLGGDISKMVPACVHDFIKEKLMAEQNKGE